MNLINRFFFILIFISVSSIAISSANENKWDYIGDAMLYQGDTYSTRGYIIEVTDFDKENGFVLLDLKKNGILLNSTVLNASIDEYIYEDEVKIIIFNSTDDPLSNNPTNWTNPRIHIEFYLLEKPVLGVDMDIHRNIYKPPDSEIHVTVEIENNGEAEIKDVDLYIDPDGLQVIHGKLIHHFGTMEEDESKSIDLKLRVPRLMSNSSFNITANISGIDTKDIVYTSTDSGSVKILPTWDLILNKITTNTSMDLDSKVDIYVKNTGIINLSIAFMDIIPPDLELRMQTVPPAFQIEQNYLTWITNLTPQEEKKYSYSLIPSKPGVFDISPVTGHWNENGINHTIFSNSPTIAVDGAYILLNKTAYPAQVECGENVTVFIKVVNTGTKAASINIIDILPKDTSPVSGNTTLNTTLQANQTASIEYTINMKNPGNITLPHPEVELVSEDYSRLKISDTATIEVSAEKPVVTPVITEQPANVSTRQELPKFEIVLVASLLFIVYLIKRRA